IIFMASGSLHAADFCGELANAYGPFDYRNSAFASNLYLIERAHFTPEVEQGVKGNAGYIGQDLDYTLRAFPNHHRALATMAKLGLKGNSVQVNQAKYPVGCYF